MALLAFVCVRGAARHDGMLSRPVVLGSRGNSLLCVRPFLFDTNATQGDRAMFGQAGASPAGVMEFQAQLSFQGCRQR
ncbi:MAG: hypothetical protein DMG26_03850 [Acidobacteria bacterium]|nr:MAG: hypothetical protein DMG26_03850 [Acidobacteriota bacterium]